MGAECLSRSCRPIGRSRSMVGSGSAEGVGRCVPAEGPAAQTVVPTRHRSGPAGSCLPASRPAPARHEPSPTCRRHHRVRLGVRTARRCPWLWIISEPDRAPTALPDHRELFGTAADLPRGHRRADRRHRHRNGPRVRWVLTLVNTRPESETATSNQQPSPRYPFGTTFTATGTTPCSRTTRRHDEELSGRGPGVTSWSEPRDPLTGSDTGVHTTDHANVCGMGGESRTCLGMPFLPRAGE
jgi:hypothetical protein